jgi:hypothetical protein
VKHLRHLKAIVDNDEAAELLALAPSKSPDSFGRAITKYLIERDAKVVRERQQHARSVKFFKADNGCVGMRVILPPLEGEQAKATINDVCDAAWRAAHLEREDTLGGPDDEPREQRLADALAAILTATAGDGSARTALIVTMQAETLECEILGAGPIPTEDALKLVDDPRTDIYAVTDIGELRHLCDADCHKDRHETGKGITRQRDGTRTVDGDTFPTWPPPTQADDPPDLESQQLR